MNKPILGKDVIIQFDRGSDFGTYFCAANIEISFQMTTKETKTIGDGVWKRKRGQSMSATITMDGVAVLSELFTTSFTLLDYFNNMTDIPFRLIFTDEQLDTRVIEGLVLPTDISLSGGAEGHANGSMTLEVNGPVDIRDEIIPCGYTISSVTYEGDVIPVFYNFTINMTPGSGEITRFDYSMDGGGIQSLFTDVGPAKSVRITVPGVFGSTHQLSIFPVCENGYRGDEYILNFTKNP